MEHLCKKCLLLEAGENAAFKTVTDYLDTLDNSLKADKVLYEKRLSFAGNVIFLFRECAANAAAMLK